MEIRSISAPPADSGRPNRLVSALREMLLRGDFKPGQRLTELGVAAILKASRTPVREALEKLAQQALLKPLRSGGFAVAEFTVDEIWDAIELRGVLEGTAARLAAERLANREELSVLGDYCDRMDALALDSPDLHESATYGDLNRGFHAEFCRLAKNVVLARSLEAVLALPFAAPGALLFDQAEPALLGGLAREHHRAILEAIENREGTRAESLAREHARISRTKLVRVLENRELLSMLPGACLIQLLPAPADSSPR